MVNSNANRLRRFEMPRFRDAHLPCYRSVSLAPGGCARNEGVTPPETTRLVLSPVRETPTMERE